MIQVSAEKKRSHDDIVVALTRSHLLILKMLRRCAADAGLTLQQFAVLRYLSQKGQLPMGALGIELGVTPPVITGIVDRLETRKMVERTDASADRRRTDILPTELGKTAYRTVRESYRSSLRRFLDRSLSSLEQERFAEFLTKFAAEIPEQPIG